MSDKDDVLDAIRNRRLLLPLTSGGQPVHATRRELDKTRAALARYNRTWPAVMTKLSADEVRISIADVREGSQPLQAWRSQQFIAMLFREDGKPALRLSVCRAMLDDDGRFTADISWDDLQQVKNECGFDVIDAVELFPAAHDVVNVQNMRHLWLLPEPSALVWRNTESAPVVVNDQVPRD